MIIKYVYVGSSVGRGGLPGSNAFSEKYVFDCNSFKLKAENQRIPARNSRKQNEFEYLLTSVMYDFFSEELSVGSDKSPMIC